MSIKPLSLILGLALAGACADAPTDPVAVTEGAQRGARGGQGNDRGGPPARAPQLNLSHIECAEDGSGVIAHFVLLFAGDATPGPITGEYSDGSDFGPVDSDKHTGNVWHYNVSLPSGWIDIESATVTTGDDKTVHLHNPGEYAGDYDCGGDEEPACSVVVEPHSFCTDQPIGSEGAECAYFGLSLIDKDDNLDGNAVGASTDAYVAIVKSGVGDCGPGDHAYRVYVDVQAGDTLESPSEQDISHITYCACPDDDDDFGVTF